jgi:hypothetical protein
VQSKLDKAKSFDSDLWIIEIEDRDGFAGITPISFPSF